jgi:hypothetical protein
LAANTGDFNRSNGAGKWRVMAASFLSSRMPAGNLNFEIFASGNPAAPLVCREHILLTPAPVALAQLANPKIFLFL